MSEMSKPGADGSSINRPLTRRQVLMGALGVGAGVAFGPAIVACGGGGGTSASPSATSVGVPKTGGHLRTGLAGGSSKESLDGMYQLTLPQNAYIQAVYDHLIDFDLQGKMSSTMGLADEITSNAKGTEWTVRLKPGVKFSNGKPITADDVIFSFMRITDPKAPKDGASQLYGIDRNAMKKVDDRTVVFPLTVPNAVFPEGLTHKNNIVVPVGYNPTTPAGAIGSGPFIVVSYTPNEGSEYKANPNYWGVGPYVDTLSMIEFADSSARLNALLGGTVDHIGPVDFAQASTVKASSGVKLLESKTGTWRPFTMRVDQKPFNDVRVRQAFRLIADRQQMIDQAYAGFGWVANDIYAPWDPAYPKDLPQRTQDLEQAKSLLKQAGYNNDLTVQLTTTVANGPGMVLAPQVFAEQAKGAGVTVKVNNIDSGLFFDQFLKWNFATDFWNTRGYLVQALYGSLPTAPYNETHWADTQWVKIVTDAIQTVDDTKRNELVAEAMNIDHERGGYLVWAFDIMLDAYSDKLGGVLPDAYGNGASAAKDRYNLMYFN